MAELERLGLPGPAALKDLLTTCSDPIEAIQNFQRENCVQLPSLHPALKLLDLHGIRRSEFHESVIQDLQQRLVDKVQALTSTGEGENRMASIERLLDQSFPLVSVPFVRPVVLECLKRLPKTPEKYLKVITSDPQLYDECSVNVRQQIWVTRQDLFIAEIVPQIESYIADKERLLRQIESPSALYFRGAGKAQRQVAQVQHLVRVIGDQVVLYDRVLQHIRQGFVDSQGSPYYCSLRFDLLMALHDNEVQHLVRVIGDQVVLYDRVLQHIRQGFVDSQGPPYYCSLRFDLLMALHDNEAKSLIDLDPCHAFTWCLDPCVRDRHLDPKHGNELKAFLDKKREASIWTDVALIAADPHVMHFFGSLAIRVLAQGVQNETLPQDMHSVHLVLRILTLGSEAPVLKSEQGEPSTRGGKLDQILFTKFLPLLMACMAEDVARGEAEKLNDKGDWDNDSLLSEPPKLLVDFLKSEPLCAILWLYYTVDLAGRRKDKTGLNRAIPLLMHCRGKVAYSEVFLHLFLSKLIVLAQNKDDSGACWATSEDFCSVILDKYLLKQYISTTTSEANGDHSLKWHLLRLLYHLGAKMPEPRVQTLMQRLDPIYLQQQQEQEVSDEYGGAYAKVQQRIAASRAEEQTHETPNTDTGGMED